jgi:hypothetical protein
VLVYLREFGIDLLDDLLAFDGRAEKSLEDRDERLSFGEREGTHGM